jgi:hypothetical protein
MSRTRSRHQIQPDLILVFKSILTALCDLRPLLVEVSATLQEFIAGMNVDEPLHDLLAVTCGGSQGGALCGRVLSSSMGVFSIWGIHLQSGVKGSRSLFFLWCGGWSQGALGGGPSPSPPPLHRTTTEVFRVRYRTRKLLPSPFRG